MPLSRSRSSQIQPEGQTQDPPRTGAIHTPISRHANTLIRNRLRLDIHTYRSTQADRPIRHFAHMAAAICRTLWDPSDSSPDRSSTHVCERICLQSSRQPASLEAAYRSDLTTEDAPTDAPEPDSH